MAPIESEIVVIGGGIAGASVAAHLAEHVSVRLLEMESQPGYHSTGRSAAQFSESYGSDVIRRLSRASRAFFFSPPPGFGSESLATPRPVLMIATEAQRGSMDSLAKSYSDDDSVEKLSSRRALELCPILRPDRLIGALLQRGPADLDVHELHQGYLRLFKARGGSITTDARVVGLERQPGGWLVDATSQRLRAAIVVNAAGAWAGEIGKMAGAHEIGLQPLRRSALMVEAPAAFDIRSWPMLMDVDEGFYLKPDAGQLLLSPADETPSVPCDAQPDELDVATAVDRVEQATTLEIKRVRRMWAGLRSFVHDRSPVVGYDPLQPGFFWLAALGGYGIQTAPALSALASALVLGRQIDPRISSFGIDPAELAPARL